MINGPPRGADSTELVNNSALYKEFLAERREILCHKWIESEKAGYDIGFERALIDWVEIPVDLARKTTPLVAGDVGLQAVRSPGLARERTGRKRSSIPRAVASDDHIL